jgi:lipopolysaccharide biosynthesis protein
LYLFDSEKSFKDFRFESESNNELFDLDPDQPESGRLAITAHIFYREWLDIFLAKLPQFKELGAILVTTPVQEFKEMLENEFAKQGITGRVVLSQNRGRNFGPLLVELSKEILEYDYFIHVHSKRSAHSKVSRGELWQERNTQFLLDHSNIKGFHQAFNQSKDVGLIYVNCSDLLRTINYRWGTSRQATRRYFGKQRGFESIRWSGKIDFPAGGMFAARVSAVQELMECEWSYSDFPHEDGQLDGTLQHGIERMIGALVISKGLRHLVYQEKTLSYSLISPKSKS